MSIHCNTKEPGVVVVAPAPCPFFGHHNSYRSFATQGLTKKMYRNIDKSFEDYLEKKHLGTSEAQCWEEGHL